MTRNDSKQSQADVDEYISAASCNAEDSNGRYYAIVSAFLRGFHDMRVYLQKMVMRTTSIADIILAVVDEESLMC